MNLKDARRNRVEITSRDERGRVKTVFVESCHNHSQYEVRFTRSKDGIACECVNADEGGACPSRTVCHHILAALLAAGVEVCRTHDDATVFGVPVAVKSQTGATVYAVAK